MAEGISMCFEASEAPVEATAPAKPKPFAYDPEGHPIWISDSELDFIFGPRCEAARE
jgi:hypothetical protein